MLTNHQAVAGQEAGLFLRRFFERPGEVASFVPSSPMLAKKTANKMVLSVPRTIAEFGPGTGVHTRELLRRSHPGSRLVLFELDPELAEYNREKFAHDPRVEVVSTSASNLLNVMDARGIKSFDYILSGIPFSLMQTEEKEVLMNNVYESLSPNARFVAYQMTTELKRFGKRFDRISAEWCPLHLPPLFVMVFQKGWLPS